MKNNCESCLIDRLNELRSAGEALKVENEHVEARNKLLLLQLEDMKKAAERLAEQLREKDAELARKDAIIRELREKLKSKQNSESERKQNNDPFDTGRRFFECLFGVSYDGEQEGTQ